jgi:hypothetical protein
MSGFFNSASGPRAGNISGFFNTANGATGLFSSNGQTSGFGNTGVPVNPTLSSGNNSGLFNRGTGIAGLFNLSRLLP